MKKQLLKIISLLVDPPASIKAPHLRRQAQFMSALILIIIPVGLLAELYYLTTTPDWFSLYLYLLGSALFIFIYVLNRTRWVILAYYCLHNDDHVDGDQRCG
jgi:membrane protein YdbS with pleckstrin-like domain